MVEKTIGIIGCGNMGEAILRRLSGRRWKIIVGERDPLKRKDVQKRCGIKAQGDNRAVAKASSIIILAVKPYDIGGVLSEVAAAGLKSKLILSIAAGVTTDRIEKALGAAIPVVRAMPNMPAIAGEGITAISPGRYAGPSHMKTAKDLLSVIGSVIVVEEGLIDAVTAISGSGPAYFFYLVECMIEAAREFGLNETDAKLLAVKTALGSARVMDSAEVPPEVLRAKVASKGGTTEAALKLFESRGLKDIIKEAIRAARSRAKELAKG